ncbi:MAG: peptidase MA family metallohydrolase [bacterium]|nr:peptidase MA family metallohydrolase [bacterium]
MIDFKRYLFKSLVALFFAASISLPEHAVGEKPLSSHEKMLESYRESLQSAPPSDKKNEALGHYYLNLGVERINLKKYEEALEAFEEGGMYIRSKRDLAYYRGLAYFLLKSYYEAESELIKIAYEGEGDFDALNLLGRVQYDRGDTDFAIDSWEQALGLRSDEHGLEEMLAKARKEHSVEEEKELSYSGRFLLLYDGKEDENIGRAIMDILADAYSDVGADLNYYPEEYISVIIYTKKEFDKVTSLPDWAGAVYDGKIRVPLGGLDLSSDRLKGVLYHEYTHAVIQSMTKGGCPKWLNEGLAVYEESRFVPIASHPDSKNSKGREISSFEDLGSLFSSSNSKEAKLAYDKSYQVVKRLIDDCGIYDLADILQTLPPIKASVYIMDKAESLCGVELDQMLGKR